MTTTNPRSMGDGAAVSATTGLGDGAPRRFFGPDVERMRLRATMVALGAEIERVEGLARVGETAPTTLPLHYEDLVKQLGLGPEPEVRVCPTCGTIGMRRATVCGNCWSALVPPM